MGAITKSNGDALCEYKGQAQNRGHIMALKTGRAWALFYRAAVTNLAHRNQRRVTARYHSMAHLHQRTFINASRNTHTHSADMHAPTYKCKICKTGRVTK